ncbi:ABC-F family ATP-binding cassette domain-containing protein [Syntrophorhabdus aromaticivorans]|uniref:ABC-F family ATP-binding cassette domain-containing protein n=1 Tax=Syntrophorhabdus aromaticivorans TaxID=328301 RepID=A0A971M2J4_9BACT|nr:ABC-F family ATP-binding cassette domain-containing protein [Syntrophorhabdus aromaticivorans]NLW34660.1 ABC-F family ATP-binding cassette domain-containing protein [Syntrophorhabdus aromaticivorans]
MLSVANLSKSYGNQVIFDGVSFAVNPCERVGLVGRNGSGKTTLFRLILGQEEYDSGTITIPKRYRVGHLSQHVRFKGKTVLKEATLEMPVHEDGTDEAFRAKKILLGLGFTSKDFDRDPLELSGGFQVRLSLARVLVSEPNLLLLDEPTNYLDIVSVRWLIQFLKAWRNELILITHDRNFMDSAVTHTMGIHRTKIKKIAGSTHKLYEQILQEEEVYEQTRVNEEKKRAEAEEFINRFRAQANRAKAVQSRIKMLEKMGKLEKMTEHNGLDFQFRAAPFHGKWLLEAENVSFSFDHGSTPLVDGLSFAIRKKDRIGVIGKNGKGKTTLFNLLAGELFPLGGRIAVHQNVKLAYFGQTNIDRLDPGRTVEEEILGVRQDFSRNAARNICGAMMFDGDKALKRVAVLSGGEKSRVLLGKLLVSPSNLLLLDEPTNHLDMESIDSLVEAIDVFPGAVVIVTHSEMILNAVAKKLIVFDKGKATLFHGTYRDFLERVGWDDEEKAEPSPATDRERDKSGVGRKELKRLRAEFIQTRSKILGPLERKMSALENTIVGLEEKINEENQSLMRATTMGEGKSIAALSISIHEARNNIERFFDELEILTRTHNARSKELEEKWSELSRSAPPGEDR